jgi:transcriptional regulator with XRE-family HTH domain
MDIGKRLHEIRAAKGLSQGDVEKRCGLLRCYISRVEHGHTVPGIETLEKLAKALQVETHELFLEGDKEPKAVPAKSEATSDTREYKLIEDFRRLDQKQQALVLGLVRKMAKAA